MIDILCSLGSRGRDMLLITRNLILVLILVRFTSSCNLPKDCSITGAPACLQVCTCACALDHVIPLGREGLQGVRVGLWEANDSFEAS